MCRCIHGNSKRISEKSISGKVCQERYIKERNVGWKGVGIYSIGVTEWWVSRCNEWFYSADYLRVLVSFRSQERTSSWDHHSTSLSFRSHESQLSRQSIVVVVLVLTWEGPFLVTWTRSAQQETLPSSQTTTIPKHDEWKFFLNSTTL